MYCSRQNAVLMSSQFGGRSKFGLMLKAYTANAPLMSKNQIKVCCPSNEAVIVIQCSWVIHVYGGLAISAKQAGLSKTYKNMYADKSRKDGLVNNIICARPDRKTQLKELKKRLFCLVNFCPFPYLRTSNRENCQLGG